MAKKDEAAPGAVAATNGKPRKERQRKPVDHETIAIANVTASLQPLSVAARSRVLGYVNSRLTEADAPAQTAI